VNRIIVKNYRIYCKKEELAISEQATRGLKNRKRARNRRDGSVRARYAEQQILQTPTKK